MKSAAIFFGANIRGALTMLAASVVMGLFIAGVVNRQGYCYFIGAVGGVAVSLAWQLHTTDFTDKDQCKKALAVSVSLPGYLRLSLIYKTKGLQ